MGYDSMRCSICGRRFEALNDIYILQFPGDGLVVKLHKECKKAFLKAAEEIREKYSKLDICEKCGMLKNKCVCGRPILSVKELK